MRDGANLKRAYPGTSTTSSQSERREAGAGTLGHHPPLVAVSVTDEQPKLSGSRHRGSRHRGAGQRRTVANPTISTRGVATYCEMKA